MRVFDIEKTCLADEFTQFNKPVKKISYSPNGDILVTCCEDGSVALHNARRQHLPTKMMHLEFVPKYIHVAFSPISRRTTAKIYKQQDHVVDLSIDRQLELNEENQNYSNMDASERTNEETYLVSESFFGIMGEYGNNLMVYDTESIILKHQI